MADIEDLTLCECYQPAVRRPPCGSVEAFNRHVLVQAGEWNSWPKKVEEIPGFSSTLGRELKARVPGTKFTLCEPVSGSAPTVVTSTSSAQVPTYDVLVFPEGVKYKAVSEGDIDSLITSIVEGTSAPTLTVESLVSQYHVFVCAHESRDSRCGSCGPVLAQQFAREAKRLGLDHVTVWHVSHVGGHDFAGNAFIYPGMKGTESGGDFYGYLATKSPADVASVLRTHVAGEGSPSDLIKWWRGRLGLTKDEHEELWESFGGKDEDYFTGSKNETV